MNDDISGPTKWLLQNQKILFTPITEEEALRLIPSDRENNIQFPGSRPWYCAGELYSGERMNLLDNHCSGNAVNLYCALTSYEKISALNPGISSWKTMERKKAKGELPCVWTIEDIVFPKGYPTIRLLESKGNGNDLYESRTLAEVNLRDQLFQIALGN